MPQTYRTGPLGALIDEYERATGELSGIVAPLSGDDLDLVRDPETDDEDCRSIRTVMHHVVRAGYGYADTIRKAFGQEIRRPVIERAASGALVVEQLSRMMAHTEATFDGRWDMSQDELDTVTMTVSWGPLFTVEQLLEHAIVHILRHRRQIERWLG
jgi:uncharacterized damage-inducible protein DinB